jgi:hypothetical protein
MTQAVKAGAKGLGGIANLRFEPHHEINHVLLWQLIEENCPSATVNEGALP